MSGMQVPAGASDSSVVLAPPQQQQEQEVTVTQFSPEAVDGIITSEVVLAPPRSAAEAGARGVTVTQFSPEAVDEIIKRYKAFPKSETDELDEKRGWLMVLATLTASITYSAALNPPGGVWQADDATNGYVAGSPVLLSKHPHRYKAFYYFNVMSFLVSVVIIVALSVPKFFDGERMRYCNMLVVLDIMSLMGAFVAGSANCTFDYVCGITVLAPLLLIVFYGESVSSSSRMHKNVSP
ncbi:hypothetical protein SETIT_4G250900v2 [Setaria italica]|uniref:PGG domain-containing protein n=1 Tax=Setaria italica TaxID=4555 RepID=K3XZ32_SETIT|nr:uncharacterized protein LOC101786588 [Setaria italica]XP_004966175.1 uncharacterized protein LOC101786588 [Setaria italica]RCV22829.1 hypothetical protein SETIT_4G250900v2 [Setaria italica]RCV22830.1 hypothetical protein SETIT_4G250900v2 [Setaria italica]